MEPAVAARLRPFFSARPEVRIAWLFGFQARGEAAAHSDIDVAVYPEERDESAYPYGYLASLCTDLGDRLRTDKIDVVDFRSASVLLRHRILHDGAIDTPSSALFLNEHRLSSSPISPCPLSETAGRTRVRAASPTASGMAGRKARGRLYFV